MIPQGYLDRLAMIESSNNPSAVNPKSGAAGLFQFMPATAKQYGLSNPHDPDAARKAAERLTLDNYAVLQSGLGRAPTQGELYLAHQQGAQGALNLLNNPDALASQVRNPQAILQNAGNETDTAAQFADQWIKKFEGVDGQPIISQENFALEMPAENVTEQIKGSGLTPEEEAELETLEAEFGTSQPSLTTEEEAELAALEAEFSETPKEKPKTKEKSIPAEIGRQLGLGARYVAESAAALPAMAANVPASGYNALANLIQGEGEGFRFPDQQQAVSNALSKLGLAQPQNATERIVGDVSRGISGTGLTARAAQGLSSTAPALAELAKNVGTQVSSAVGGSLAGGLARESGAGILGQSLATLAGGLGGGAVGAKINPSSVPQSTRITSDDIRKRANAAYQEAASKGGTLQPQFTDKFVSSAQKVMPQTAAGKIVSGDNEVTKIVNRMDALKGKPISLTEAQEIDEFLGDAIDNFTEMGRVTKQGKKLLDIQSEFRDMINNVDPADVQGGKEGFEALKRGRALWSRAAKLRDVERIVEHGMRMDNPATSIRSGFRTLLNNPNRLKGYSKAEVEAIKNAAESGIAADTLRVFGSRLIPIVTTASGAGGLAGMAASQAGSTLSRSAATNMQLGRANALMDLVSGTPKAPAQSKIPQVSGALQSLIQQE